MNDMSAAIRGITKWKEMGPDSLHAELLKLDHSKFDRYFVTYLSAYEERVTPPSNNGKMRPLR